MNAPIHIRFAGYSPPDTTHSRAVKHFRDALITRLGDDARVDLFWNVFDFGYKGMELYNMVEDGRITMCYSSTAYGLSGIIPELQIIDLPYIFRNREHAHHVLDGELGAYLTEKIEAKTSSRVLGYWDNGFRHISNSLRPIRTPEDCAGLRIRLMPAEIHRQTFMQLGAVPFSTDLEQGIAMMERGELDAQENPLANTMSYGIHKLHKHITMTGHFYAVRGIFVHKNTFDSWSRDIQKSVRESVREAITFQRKEARAEELKKRRELEKEGVVFTDLSEEERSRFVDAVQPVIEEAQARLPADLLGMLWLN